MYGCKGKQEQSVRGRLTKDKSSLTNLTVVCDEMTAYADEGRGLGGGCIGFSDYFNTIRSRWKDQTPLLDMADGIIWGIEGYSHKLEVQIEQKTIISRSVVQHWKKVPGEAVAPQPVDVSRSQECLNWPD